MKTYQSHKRVEAAKIASMQFTGGGNAVLDSKMAAAKASMPPI
jgi:hypothetical protein